MYMADTTVMSGDKYPEVFEQMEKDLRLSKNLYNAALFRIRQVFTGWDKEQRTENEEEVFREVRAMQAAYPKVKVRRVLSYRALDAIMRANRNPDFFAGLSMQTAQRVLKEAVTVFKAWLFSLKEYRRAPEKYTGKPCMPKYLKNDRHTFYVTNQDAVLYPVYRGMSAAGRTGTQHPEGSAGEAVLREDPAGPCTGDGGPARERGEAPSCGDRLRNGQHRSHRIDGPCVPYIQRRCCPFREPVLPKKEGGSRGHHHKGEGRQACRQRPAEEAVPAPRLLHERHHAQGLHGYRAILC